MATGEVLQVGSLTEFFREALHGAAARQSLALADHTEQYVVNILTTFARADAFYEPTPDGPRLRPLALMLGDTLYAPTLAERQRALQRLGDVSLFIAGFFARGFAKRLVDVDYHIAMGGRAYGSLADSARASGRGRSVAGVFDELAHKFGDLVDALHDIADAGRAPTHDDLLRLYEIWLKTGSRHAEQRLRMLGIEPTAAARSRFQH